MPIETATQERPGNPTTRVKTFRMNTSRMNTFMSFPVVVLAVLITVSVYLLSSSRAYGIGFPLDDAWIHQTYARNLGLRGEWAFIPGQPSAGSTAPLWSVLLSIGYLLRLNPLAWTFLIGGLSLLGLAWVGEGWFRALQPALRSPIPWAGLFLVGEWHLAWAAVSGMETLLMGLLILFVLWQLTRTAAGSRFWLIVGLWVGLSVWVRPDGITLLGPAAFTLLLNEVNWKAGLRKCLALAAGLVLLLIPYLLFNLAISSSVLPNTFYAKQAEYAVQRQIPIWMLFFDEVTLPMIGGGLFLLPGFIAFAWQAWRERHWSSLGAVLWFLGYGLLYALRLPVVYQYGRYFMPAMPVYFVTGLAGTAYLLTRLRGSRVTWLLARAGVLSGVLVWLAFFVIGAGRYAQDVTFIETQMVKPALWVADHTPSNALIAVHDIGAMGYFGQRRVLDLAGLVSPEVIPFIRDEDRLATWLDQQKADYLVILSGWYAHLPDGKEPVFQPTEKDTAPSGGMYMWIYRWRSSSTN